VVSGPEYFLDLLGFDRHLDGVNLVLTGEGRLDHQTRAGKLPAVVARRASPTPAIAVVGCNDLEQPTTLFTDIVAVADRTERDTARDRGRTAAELQAIGTSRRATTQPHHPSRQHRAFTKAARPWGARAYSKGHEFGGMRRSCRRFGRRPGDRGRAGHRVRGGVGRDALVGVVVGVRFGILRHVDQVEGFVRGFIVDEIVRTCRGQVDVDEIDGRSGPARG